MNMNQNIQGRVRCKAMLQKIGDRKKCRFRENNWATCQAKSQSILIKLLEASRKIPMAEMASVPAIKSLALRYRNILFALHDYAPHEQQSNK